MERRSVKREPQFPKGAVEPVVMVGGASMASKVQAGDADPAVGIEDKTGSTGISCGKMCFILIRIETMDQDRPVVLREAKTEQQLRCWPLVKEVPPKGQGSGRLVVSQQAVASMAVTGKVNHEIFPRGFCRGWNSSDDVRGNRAVELDESGIPDSREPVIGGLGMKGY